MKKNKLTAARIILTALTVAAVAAIFYNSSLNAAESTEQSSPLTDMINAWLHSIGLRLTVSEKLIRKLAHFTEYSVLGVLMSATVYLYRQNRKRMMLTALPIGALTAAIDELIQKFAEGRSSQLSDVLIDCCGVCFGALIVWLVISLIENKKRKRTYDRLEALDEGREKLE